MRYTFLALAIILITGMTKAGPGVDCFLTIRDYSGLLSIEGDQCVAVQTPDTWFELDPAYCPSPGGEPNLFYGEVHHVSDEPFAYFFSSN